MNNWGIEPDDWFKRIFGSSNFPSSRGGTGSGDWFRDMPRQFEQMRREMERIFQEQFTDIDETKVPDGRPKVREFGNIKSPTMGFANRPLISGETEPLADVTTTDKDVKVVVEMPGIEKKDIKINAHDSTVEVFTINSAPRKYRKVIEVPSEADIETARSTYKNGILEITLNKKVKPSSLFILYFILYIK